MLATLSLKIMLAFIPAILLLLGWKLLLDLKWLVKGTCGVFLKIEVGRKLFLQSDIR